MTLNEIEVLAIRQHSATLPGPVARASERTRYRFVEFFTAHIRNANTRRAYGMALGSFFSWCEQRHVELEQIDAVTVAAYVEQLTACRAAPTVKLQLAAIRSCFDWLVTGQIIPFNPAASVRGPKYSLKRGKTPVLRAEEARRLLDSIDTSTIGGLRDRALIALMAFSFARIGATLEMLVADYFVEREQRWLRLHEKCGKLHHVPAHPTAVAYLDAYIVAAGIAADGSGPLFRTLNRHGVLTSKPMSQSDALKMIKRRARQAALPTTIGCHTFRATGITTYLENGGTIEGAQAIAAHESPRTTKLYDRRGDRATIQEVQRIAI
jgi:integrase/recombinase XerD